MPVAKKTLKLLGVGNSFLKNATGSLPGIVKAAGHDLVLCQAAPGGWTLEMHYTMAMLNEANPDDPKGKPYDYKGKKMSLKDVLAAEKWDYVTIQQSSPNSFKIETYRPHARNLCDYIRRHAPDAEVVFHQTWAWRSDHTRQNMHEQEDGFMYRGLTRAYHTIAKEVGITKIIPVGDAFQLAGESPAWKFERDVDFDYTHAKYPDLPQEKNSLHGGFAWRDAAGSADAEAGGVTATAAGQAVNKVLRLDGSHASGAGMYLAACVWFEFFYGEDVRKVEVNPGFLGKERAASLREIAHQVVAGGVKPAAWPEDLAP